MVLRPCQDQFLYPIQTHLTNIESQMGQSSNISKKYSDYPFKDFRFPPLNGIFIDNLVYCHSARQSVVVLLYPSSCQDITSTLVGEVVAKPGKEVVNVDDGFDVVVF